MHEGLLQKQDHILIVDDDNAILRLLKDFFERIGFSHRLAGDGLQALSLMEQEPANIVITDILMPNMDGMELIKEVKARWPDTDIIVMTGFTRDFTYTDVIKAGASDFIQKPFSLDELEAKLVRLIRERDIRARLEQLSFRDSLTNLYNRRFFDQRLKEEAERANRQGYDLYLAVVDIDNFKELNDQKGHSYGDDVLINLGEVLKNSIRNYVDTPCRIGGDEFAVILPHVNALQAQSIAERMRKNYIDYIDRGETTLSIGMARFKKYSGNLDEDIDRLICEADNAMYAAKKIGGNRVVVMDAKVGLQKRREEEEICPPRI